MAPERATLRPRRFVSAPACTVAEPTPLGMLRKRMSPAPYTDEQVDAAIEAITRPGAFGESERAVARAAPQLQRVLAEALNAGGWFGESHEGEILKAATAPDEDDRLAAVRVLLAEEARMGMMVGVSVGWALAEELARTETGAEGAPTDPHPEED